MIFRETFNYLTSNTKTQADLPNVPFSHPNDAVHQINDTMLQRIQCGAKFIIGRMRPTSRPDGDTDMSDTPCARIPPFYWLTKATTFNSLRSHTAKNANIQLSFFDVYFWDIERWISGALNENEKENSFREVVFFFRASEGILVNTQRVCEGVSVFVKRLFFFICLGLRFLKQNLT